MQPGFGVRLKKKRKNAIFMDKFKGKIMPVVKLNQIKRHNLVSALRQFCEHDRLSRRELAALMQCDHATATRVVKTMLERHLLIPVGKQEVAHGRPREMLELHPDSPLALGLELHPHAVSAAVIDLRGRELFSVRTECSGGRDAYREALKKCFVSAAGATARSIGGSGLAAIGTLSSDGGVIGECANAPELNGFDLAGFWRENDLLSPPVVTDRMLAEMYAFLTREPSLRRGVTLLVDSGSGIGMALACDGRIVNMERRHGGEFGHNTVLPDGERCRCGRRGCLEAYASTAILADRFGVGSMAELRELAAVRTDAAAAIRQGARLFALALANQINNLLPDQAVITGGLLALGEIATETIRCCLQSQLLGSAARHLKLEFRPQAPDAALGAALLARERFLERFSQAQ